MNLFHKAKIRAAPVPTVLHSPTPLLKQGESKFTLGRDTSQAHPSYDQQFLSVNVSNLAAQCQISWLATARKHRVSNAEFT